VITVSQDMGDTAKVTDFLKSRGGPTLEPWLDPKGDLAFKYGAGTLPTTLLYDSAGREGANHLFLTDQKGVQYIDTKHVDLPFGRLLVDDILNRTETAMTQDHCFLAMELALQAQAKAETITFSSLPTR